MTSMTKIVLAVVLVFGFGGYFAARVIGAEPTLPSVRGPVTVGASNGPTGEPSNRPSDDNTPKGRDNDVDEVRPSPSDIGDDHGDDEENHDLGDDHSGDDHSGDDGDDGDDDNSGPGSGDDGGDDD
jgi:hypothetical protein